MLRRSIEIEVPISSAAVLSGPDPYNVLDYLRRGGSSDFRSAEDGVFSFRLLFPSKHSGGRAHMPEIMQAKVFINGNSGVQTKTCDFSGVLLSLGDCKFEQGNRQLIWIDYLAGVDGGERIGEIRFECSIDYLLACVANEQIHKAA